MDIDEISDRLEIEQLMVKYVDAIDDKNWELLDDDDYEVYEVEEVE